MDVPKQVENPKVQTKVTKLRESCDSCLVAKVKCSKSRPVCVRCLANGATCGYSPSSRAGRKHRNAGAIDADKKSTRYENSSEPADSSPPTPTSTSYLRMMYPMLDHSERPNFHSTDGNFQGSSKFQSQDRRNSRQSGAENGFSLAPGQRSESADFFPTPPYGDDIGDFLQFSPSPFLQDPNAVLPSPSSNACPTPATTPWTLHENSYPTFQIPLDLMSFGPPSSSGPAAESSAQQEAGQETGQSGPPTRYSCDCFAVCLQALQTLHNHSWLPASTQAGGLPFDVVLTINREAMGGCAAMLDCAKCVSKSGSSISTMLLATIFGKIISLYGAACFFRFGPATSSQAVVKLAFGAYTLTGEDRRLLEMEIILLELKKVESILHTYQERFRHAQAEKDETSVYNALTSYLDKNLRYILDFLQSRKGGICI